jgi:hypothetical protein
MNEIIRRNRKFYAAFLDIKAAYDCVDRRILWTNISEYLGDSNSPWLIAVIRSLFDYNESSLLINGTQSTPIQNTRGLLQGSSLSPIFFNIFIDSLLKKLDESPANTKIFRKKYNRFFFADDGTLIATTPEVLQTLLTVCGEWSTEHGITFAPSKSFILTTDRNSPTFNLQGVQLPKDKFVKYLGLYLSSQGISWKKTIESRIQKAQQTLLWLIRSGLHKGAWRPKTAITVYKLFCRSFLEYGFQLGPIPKTHLQKLEKIQLTALRAIFGLPKSSPKLPIYILSNTQPLSFRSDELQARYFQNLSQNTSIPASQAFTSLRNYRRLASRHKTLFHLKKTNPVHRILVNPSFQALSTTRRLRKARLQNIKNQFNCKPTHTAKALICDDQNNTEGEPPKSILRPHNIITADIPNGDRFTIIRWMTTNFAPYDTSCQQCPDSLLSKEHMTDCAMIRERIQLAFPNSIPPGSSMNPIDRIIRKFNHKKTHFPKTAARKISNLIRSMVSHCVPRNSSSHQPQTNRRPMDGHRHSAFLNAHLRHRYRHLLLRPDPYDYG